MNDNQPWYRCTICGQEGTVGRCCGMETRIPLNDAARAEQAQIKADQASKLFSAADLEQAREQGAEDARARCIEAIRTIGLGFVPDAVRIETRDDCIDIIAELGPIGKTQTEIEANERARCLARIQKIRDVCFSSDDKIAEGYSTALDDAMRELRALGPIGETREETEKQIIKEWIAAARAYREMTVCYRIGRRPTEKLFDQLKRADTLLDAIAEGRV